MLAIDTFKVPLHISAVMLNLLGIGYWVLSIGYWVLGTLAIESQHYSRR